METAPLIMVLALVLAVVVVAVFLITVVYILHMVSNRLNKILGAVGGVVEKTEGLQPLITEIREDLLGGQATIEGAVSRLAQRKGAHAEPEAVGASPAYTPPSGFSNY